MGTLTPFEKARQGIQALIVEAERKASDSHRKMEIHNAEAFVLRNALHELEKNAPAGAQP